MDDSMTDLPFVGEPDVQNTLSAAIDRMRVMGVTSRGTHTAVHPECINLYLYGNEDGDGAAHVVPKIQGMINAAVAQAVRNIPNICLKVSVEGDGGPNVLTTGQEAIMLDSSKICDFYQHVMDTVLARSGFKKFYRKAALYGKIFGWQDAIADENHAQYKMDLRIFPPTQWYKPSDVEEIEDMSFFGVDIPVDAEWAKKKYPALKEKITEVAARAVQQASGASGYSSIYTSQTWAYPIVTLGIFFMRNREVPMTAQESISTGDFESREVPMEGSNELQQPSPALVGGAAPVDAGASAGAVEGGGTAPDAAQSGGSVDLQAAQTREAVFHVATNQEVTPAHELWPTKYVMSKSIQIVGEVVEDVVWDGVDFPVLTNINIRVPNQPFGQSDCIRVRTQQNDINDNNDSLVHHGQWWKGPISMWPLSLQELLPPEFRNIGLQPNRTYFVPDEVLRTMLELYKGNNLIGQFDPPALPPHLMQLQNYLGSCFDTVGNRPDVSQGTSPTANASGELAKVLLDASQQQNDFASLGLEDMALRLGHLTLDYITRVWTVEDFLRFNKTYDAQTVQYIIETEKTMEWEIEVDAAIMKQQRDAQVRADFDAGLIDEETTLDLLQYDAPQIMQRKQQAAQAAVAGANGSNPTQLQGQNPSQQPAGNGSFKLAGAAA